MKMDAQLKLQAYLDGELPSVEAVEVAEWLARDAGARDLFAELTCTRNAVRGNEAGVTLPESREFYWSKIQREIDRLDKPVLPVAEHWLTALRHRWLSFRSALGAFAAVMLAVFFMFDGRNATTYTGPEEISNLNAEMNSISFRSEAHRMTVVFLFDREPAPQAEVVVEDVGDDLL